MSEMYMAVAPVRMVHIIEQVFDRIVLFFNQNLIKPPAVVTSEIEDPECCICSALIPNQNFVENSNVG